MKCSLYREANLRYRIEYKTNDRLILNDNGELKEIQLEGKEIIDLEEEKKENIGEKKEGNEGIAIEKTEEKRIKIDSIEDILLSKNKCLEKLFFLDRKISEYYSYADNARTGLRYKSESCIFAFQLREHNRIIDILNQLSYWPSIDSIHLKYQCYCNFEANNLSEALKNIVDICSLNYFSIKLLTKFWKKAEEISENITTYTNLPKIYARCKRKIQGTQGELLNLSIKIASSLNIPLKFQKIFAKFMRDDLSFVLESDNIIICPGDNYITLRGFLWYNGKLKLEYVSGIYNKLTCFFTHSPVYVLVDELDPIIRLDIKIPSLLILKQNFLILIEIRAQNEEIGKSVLSLNHSGVKFI